MVAVGDGRCVSWAWAVVVICCAFVVSWSLWLFVFVGVIVCGRYGQSSPFAVWAVVVGRRVS